MARLSTLALLLPFTLILAACGGDDDETPAETGGPIDGIWKVTALTCDGAEQQLGDFDLVVDNDSGQFIQRFGPECVVTIDEAYSYPDGQTFSILPEAISCDPSTACPAVFGGAECPPLPPPTDFGYTVDGNEMTFTRTAETPADAPCMPGQAMLFTLQQQ